RIAIGRDGIPAVDVTAEQAIGRAHDVDGRSERKHRELVDQQEGELAAGCGGFSHDRGLYRTGEAMGNRQQGSRGVGTRQRVRLKCEKRLLSLLPYSLKTAALPLRRS